MLHLLSFKTETDPKLLAKVAEKHKKYISELKALGFQEFYTYRESTFPGALLVAPIGFLPLLASEVAWLDAALRIHATYSLFKSPDGRSIALVFKLGVMFFTFMSDGWTVQSANYRTNRKEDKYFKLSRRSFPGDSKSAWNLHLKEVELSKQQGRSVTADNLFDKYIDIYQRRLPGELIVGAIVSWALILGLAYVGIRLLEG